MSDGEALLSIKADVAQASRAVRKLAKDNAALEKSVADLGKENDKLTGKVEKLTAQNKKSTRATVDYVAKLGLAVQAVQGAAVQLDTLSKRAISNRAVMDNLAYSINGARESTMGLVTDMDLMIGANQAARLGVAKSDKEFAKLADAATKLGLSVGRDATESLNDLISGLGRGSTEVLDNLGVMLRANEAYAEYAGRLGKAASELTDAEKKQAVMTIGMEKAIKAASDLNIETDSAALSFQQLTVQLKNAANDALRMTDLVNDLGKELSIALGYDTFTEYEDGIDLYFSALTLGLDDAIAKWIEYNKQAYRGVRFTMGQNVAQNVQDFIDNQAKTTERGNVSFKSKEAEKARQDAAWADAMIAGGVGDAWGGPVVVEEPKKKTGGKREKRGPITARRDTNAEFSGAVAAEAERLAFEREQEMLVTRMEAQQVAADHKIAQLERESEMQFLLAGTEQERFDAQQAHFERQQEMAQIEAEQAQDRLVYAQSEEERIAATEELRQAQHEANMLRIEQEMQAEQWAVDQQQKMLQRRMKIAQTTVDITGQSVSAMGQIWTAHAEQQKVSEKVMFGIQKGIEVADLSIRAISYGIKSAAAFAAQNYFAGATNAAAAAIAGAGAISTAALSPDSARGKAGIGGGGGGGGGITQPLGNTQSPSDSNIPGSRGGSPVQPGGANGGRSSSGGSTTINIQNVHGSADADFAERLAVQIKRIENDGRGLGA